MHQIDRVVDRLASRQYGAFALHQLLAHATVDRRAVYALADRRVAAGRWMRLDATHVFALPGHPHSWHQRAMAASLVVPGAVVSGRAAGVLWGLEGLRPGGIEVTIPRARRVRTSLARVRRSDLVVARRQHGIAVTSLPMAVMQLAAEDRWSFDGMVEQAIVDGLIDLPTLRDAYVRHARSGVAGAARLRRFLDQRADDDPVAESELERRLLGVATHPEIPTPELQAPFPWRPAAPFRVDALLRRWCTILEGDGRRWHARLEAMDADRRRDREAMANGHLPLRFGHGELSWEPEACREEILLAGRDHGRRLAPEPHDRRSGT